MNEQSLFLSALEIDDPVQRHAWLDQDCADNPELRREVETLLDAHDQSGPFLDIPALEQFAGEQVASENIGGEQTLEDAGKRNADDDKFFDDINFSFLTPSDKPELMGCLLHYEILELVGRGGYGIVFRAFDRKLHRVVAIKVMQPTLTTTSPARKRFLREARATAAVRHPSVIDIFSVEEQPLPFIVMDFINGRTLQDKLNATGPLELSEIITIGSQIADGLQAAHDRGLVHRDIKPANILLERGTDTVKITDFGLARTLNDASLTQSGMISGTPLYMSPEQALGAATDSRSDLFSLGSVLYVMCCGRPPFRAPTIVAVLGRVIDDEPRALQELIPDIPLWLVSIIARLQSKKPADRLGSAQETAGLLTRCHGRAKAEWPRAIHRRLDGHDFAADQRHTGAKE